VNRSRNFDLGLRRAYSSKSGRQCALRVGASRDEKRLVSNLIAAIRRLPGARKNVEVVSELDCFQGVADVVAGTYNGYRLFPNSPNPRLGSLSFSTAKVLAALSGKRTSSVSKIVLATGLSSSTVRKELALLNRLRLIENTRDGRISIIHPIRPPFKQIEAFEVKVKDWRGGIYQARNYKSFANKVSVVLPLRRATRLRKRLHDFRKMRVGLLAIAPSGDLKWFLKPRHRKPISSARNFLASVRLLRQARHSRN
jgi:hypothetical protein